MSKITPEEKLQLLKNWAKLVEKLFEDGDKVDVTIKESEKEIDLTIKVKEKPHR